MTKWMRPYQDPSRVPIGELFHQVVVRGPKVKDICESRHKGNPESVAAFQSIQDRLTAAQQRVLNCIRNSDGLTCNEIAEKLGLTPNQVSGRCSELKRDGKIHEAGKRLTKSGCTAAILKITQ